MKPQAAVERALQRLQPSGRGGRILEAVGLLLVAEGLVASVGELCLLHLPWGEVAAEVVGFREEKALLMPLGEMKGVQKGVLVEALDQPLRIGVGPGLVGRVLGPLGEPLDGGPLWEVAEERVLEREAPPALERPPIRERMAVGVRAIDHLLTLGKGQRMGIFAGSGVGKSTLLGMIA
ncbi:MAG: flagellum-specific ATP synthase FliI, partial [Bacillota bacterium]|nr:flagellum-specific ATP synthase FliI [Bacillota bacterium]